MPEIAEQMEWPHYLVNGYLLAILVGFLAVSTILVLRIVRGQPVIPMEPRRDVPWNGIFPGLMLLLVALLTLLFISQSVFKIDSVPGHDEPPANLTLSAVDIWLNSLLTIVVAAVTVVLLVVAAGARSLDFGFSTKHFAGDIKLGVATFLFFAPLIFGLQAALSKFDSTVHPIIQFLQDHPSRAFFVASLVATVLVAPVVEEFFFRVILQGWLEKIFCRDVTLPPVVADLISEDLPGSLESPVEILTFEEPALSNPHETPSTDSSLPAPQSIPERRPLVTPGRKTGVPVVISAIVFALAHLGHGVAPISLFFLALGLGFLYLRTHRILPCIVVHGLLNFTSMLVLWINVWYPIDVAG